MRDTGNKGHGGVNRGLAAGAIPGVAFGRYGRMFEDLQPAQRLPDAALRAIALSMIKSDKGAPINEPEPADENPSIPAGYTYFGQFVDHDITFDPTPLNAAQTDVDAIVDFRSPALDLDNVFGRGPDDQPYMYDGLQLRVGGTPGAADAVFGTKNDIARLGDGTAILGDKRNDENKLVSQVHGAIIRFYNKVADDKPLLEQFSGPLDVSTKEIAPKMQFRAAAQLVRWHYQWIVVHDYLKRICMPHVVDEVLNLGGTPQLQNYLKQAATSAYMPIEFAGAAFRFGHSMIRPSYSLNGTVLAALGDKTGKTRIPTFSRKTADTDNLNGFPGRLANLWGMDFGFFFDVPAGPSAKAFRLPQHSYRIDATLADPLQDLPEFFKEIDPTTGAPPSILGNLAFRNLARGQSLGLPSGEEVARHLGLEPVPTTKIWTLGSSKLTDPKKLPGDKAADFDSIDAARKSVSAAWVVGNGRQLQGNTPLWYYILREAEWFGVEAIPGEPGIGFGGQHLGPVGSRIVAETIIGLLWKDKSSFLHDLRGFRPLPAVMAGDASYTFASLVKFAMT